MKPTKCKAKVGKSKTRPCQLDEVMYGYCITHQPKTNRRTEQNGNRNYTKANKTKQY